MSLLSIISAFFGITLVYTGFLVSANHMAAGLGVSCAGVLLLAKPALEAARLFRGQSSRPAHPPRPRSSHRKTKKVYLKIVKSEDDKPTIH